MTDTPAAAALSPLQKAAVAIKSLRARAETAENALNEPVAVVGMACRLPAKGTSPDALWEALKHGRSGSVEVPADRWDVAQYYDPEPGVPGKMYVSKACFIDEVDKFDPLFFRISPREAVGIDPQQRLLLEMVHEALEDAGLPPFDMAGSKTGVFLGISTNDYSALLSRTAHGSSNNAGAGSGNAASVASGRISYTFGFQGPCFSVDTACSSSLVSAHLAVQSLRNRESDVALVAGVNLMLTPDVSINFCQGRMLSPDGLCKSFDEGADGYVRGEGCGVLVLKRLADAQADGDRVLAVVSGSALNQDGKSAGLTAPNGTAQVAVIRDALKNAGIDRDDIDFIEAHGTGTSLGDPIEMHALRNVFEGRDRPLNVGSVKASIGHAEAAAGISGLIKAVMMLRHQELPPHPCFNTLNPHIELDDFQVDIALEHAPAQLRHIGVSSFGFSGTNAHVILSAAPDAKTQTPVAELPDIAPTLLISAQSPEALARLQGDYIALLENGASFADLAHSAQVERSRYKVWLVAQDLDSLRGATPMDGPPPNLPAQPGRRVPLPKTPFQRKRYWIDTTPAETPTVPPTVPPTESPTENPGLSTPVTGHPLLGHPVTLPFSTETRFANRLSLADPRQAFLADHHVQGKILMPGAAILDMAAEARPGQAVQDLRFVAPLELDPDLPRDVQMICDAQGGFRVVSYLAEAVDQAIVHATGRFAPMQPCAAAPFTEDLPHAIEAATFYGAMSDYGIHYGPAFQVLDQIRRAPDQASASITIPDGPGALTPVLDGALQLVGVALDHGSDAVFVPYGVGHAQIHRAPKGRVQVHVRAERIAGEVRAQILIHDQTGPLIELSGVSFRAKAGARNHGFHRLEWQDALPLEQYLPPAFPEPQDLAQGLQTLSDEMTKANNAADYGEAEEDLNRLATAYAITALERLGLRFEPGEGGGIGALADTLGIADAQRRLFTHILGFLAKDGILKRSGRRWAVIAAPPKTSIDPDALAQRLPAMAAEIAVLARCGNALDQVLTGAVDPLSLLFPKDGAGAGSFYEGSGYADTVNAMVERLARDLATATGPSRPLRVLEIGAGTGATTQAVLSGIGAQHLARYDFTDISPAFLAAAERAFPQPQISRRRLDIEKDPQSQGFATGAADLVIAANVLHATCDISQSLAHTFQMMAPGGMLVLVESTQPRRWVDLVFGLTNGWWRFTDLELRPDHPLMTHQTWHLALQQAGFHPAVLEGLDVLIARKPLTPVTLAQTLGLSGAADPLVQRLDNLGVAIATMPSETHHIHVLPQAAMDEAGQVDLFMSLCALATDLANRAAPPRLTVIASPNAVHAGLSGFLRSLRLEHPELHPRLLIADGNPALALDEALYGAGEEEVSYQNEQRQILRLAPQDDSKAKPVRGTWLITGGAGGLGRAVAAYLAEQGAERLILIGRKPPKDLPEFDLPVTFAQGDAADAVFVQNVISANAPLSGVVHAAGLLANAPITAQTQATTARVFHAKIGGAIALDAATRDLDLDHFILFSSAAGILGAARQANHAFAATFLDGLVQARRAAGLPGLALDWGIWRDIGSAARLGFDAQAEDLGLGSIAPDQGVAAFGAALALDDAQMLVVPGADFTRFTANFPDAAPKIYATLTDAPDPVAPEAKEHATPSPTAKPAQDLLAGLSRIIADILQIDGAVDTEVPLYDYGLDSLVAVEIKNRAEKELNLSLQISDLIEGATIRALVGGQTPPSAAPQGQGEASAALSSAPPISTSTSAETQLHAIIASILHLEAPIDPRTPLFEYGLDSLVAVEIRNKVEKDMGVTLQISDLIEGASTADLLDRISAGTTALAAQTSDTHDDLSPVQNLSLSNDAPRRIIPDPQNRHQPFPLTEIQSAYWLGRRGDVALGGVGCYLYTEFDTQIVDFKKLEEAWNRLVARHDMLRLVINADGTQQILPQVPRYTFEDLDLTGLDETTANAQLQHRRETLSSRVVEPSQWPLFDLRVTRHAGGARFHLGFDLIALDAASIHGLRREWALLYENLDQDLPDIGLSFRDVVLEERGFRHSAAYKEAESYWMARAKSLPTAPDLPMTETSNAPAQASAPHFKRHPIVLAKEQADQLKAQCRAHRMTLASVLAAAYADTLASFARDPHFSVTVTSFNRPDLHPDMSRVLGDFTSTMLLEVDAGDKTFTDRARQLADQMARDLDHAAVSGVQVLRERARQNTDGLRTVPVVFTSALGFRNRSEAQSKFDGWDRLGKTVYSVSSTPQVWIDHQISEEDGALFCNWDVLQGIFPDGVIEAMTAAHEALLQGLAMGEAWDWPLRRAQPNMPRALMRPAATPQFLHQGFCTCVAKTPEAIALVTPDQNITYAELHEAAKTVAWQILSDFGTPEDTRDQLIAVTSPKSWQQVAEVLGILMAGAAYVPLDPNWPAARRRSILEASGAIELAPDWLGADLREDPLPEVIGTDRLAYVIYTSGSTGAPKGVMIEHRAAHATLAQMNERWHMSPGDRVLGVSSLSFDLSVYDCFAPLAAGGALVLPRVETHPDPALWAEAILEHGVTIWNSAPALMALLLDHGLPSAHALRLVLLSGDWIPLDTVTRLKTMAPAAQLVSLGGATEAAIWSNFHEIDALDPEWRSIPYGTPLDGQMLHVSGAEGGALPDWTTGEIQISGAGLARGYLNDPARTADRFRIDPVTGERRYRTGDIGRFRPYRGQPPEAPRPIEFLGREDFQVKVQGHRIELGEIETVLERHPDIQRAVVRTLDLSSREKALAGFVVLSDHHTALPLPAAVASVFDNEAVRLSDQDFNANAAFLTRQTGAAVLRACKILTGSETMPTAAQLITHHGVSPRYRHWLNRTLPLAQAALDAKDDLVSIKDLPSAEHFGFGSAELDLLDNIIADLPALLTEEKSTAEIYLSAQTPEVYDRLFEAPNRAIAKALAALAQHRPLSVLEVGGGLGTTLAALSDTIRQHAIRYHYTDISPTLCKIANGRVGAIEGLRYSLLDMAAVPEPDAETYDVLVITSALHVARDISVVLAGLRRRLKPGGILLALEETRFLPWYDLNMGLQADFDSRTDLDLRPHHPLLSRDQWKDALATAGFDAVEIPTLDGSLTDRLGFDVIIAQTRSDAQDAQSTSSDALRRYLAEHLPSYMVPRRIEAIAQIPLSPNGKVDRTALHLREQPQDAVHVSGTSVLDGVCDLIKASLGLNALDPHRSLFEVGASSISIVALQRQLGDTFGRQISLQSIFEDPTAAALARVIEGNEAPTSGLIRFGIGAVQGPRDWRARPRLIMMPGIFALPFYLRDLAELLAPEIEVVSVQLPGLYGDEQPLDTIEAQVDYVLERICKDQPEGPYYLGGHSYGGTVAFEAARRLRASGAEVPVVILGDSVRTRTRLEAFQDDDVAGLAMLRGLGALFTDDLPEFDPSPSDPRAAFREMAAQLAKKGVFGPAALPFDQFVAMFKANFRALGAYVPPDLAGDLVLLRTEGGFPKEFGDHEPAETLADPTLGWGEAVLGEVRIRDVPGDHLSLMTPETLKPTADHIRTAIMGKTERS